MIIHTYIITSATIILVLLTYTATAAPSIIKYKPSSIDCKERWFKQTLDHFRYDIESSGTFNQRYFTCLMNGDGDGDDSHHHQWNPQTGSIFFYVGNEADVELYVNETGLMWESAMEMNAMLIFAEHRYFGKSMPFGADTSKHMSYLSPEQALADYAVLLYTLKEEWNAPDTPVVAFGGSYGGMLATWARLKYPHLFDGAIAASAPIWAFYGEDPEIDMYAFAKIITRDASSDGGSSDQCAMNIRRAWKVLFERSKTIYGRSFISDAFRLCRAARSEDDIKVIADWSSNAFDYLAMGNYVYPSSYILNGKGVLPAFPVRVACSKISADYGDNDFMLLRGLQEAVSVFYNYTGSLTCVNQWQGVNNATSQDGLFWDYLACTEMVMPEERDGIHDMFWPVKFDFKSYSTQCMKKWGVSPRPHWATQEYEGRHLEAASNIVFTNGGLDPWSGYGVVRNESRFDASVIALYMPEGAHHIDLFFANPADPPNVRDTRNIQRDHIRRWISQRRSK